MTRPRKPQGARRPSEGHGAKRPRKEEALLVALLTARTVGEAAAKAGIGERTAKEWLADPAFRARLAEARRQVFDAALVDVQLAAGEAVATLRRLLTCGHSSTEARSAGTIFAQAVRARELGDLEERMARLEAKLASLGATP